MQGYINSLYAQQAAEQKAQRLATQAVINRYKDAQEQARRNSIKYLQAADIQRQFNVRDANQLLSARGQTGGLAETNVVRNQSRYENTANSIRSDLDDTLKENDRLIAEEEAKGQAKLQEIAARYTAAIAKIQAEMAAAAAASAAASAPARRSGGTAQRSAAPKKTAPNSHAIINLPYYSQPKKSTPPRGTWV